MEYRKILGDKETDDEKIKKRIQYLESFCRSIIKSELEIYVKSKKTNIHTAHKSL